MRGDYKNGKIYKIVNSVNDEIYVGSTVQPLCNRKVGHKEATKKHPNRRICKHITTVGLNNIKLILIESYSCVSRMELEKRERHWIDTLKPSLNMIKPATTPEQKSQRCKEYYLENKEHLDKCKKIYAKKHEVKTKIWNKQWRADNKDSIRERTLKWREEKKDILSAKSKIHYKKNRAQKIANAKAYYERNKTKPKFVCECGSSCAALGKSRHLKTKYHIAFMESKKP
jgi:group I intron endonuclease